MHSFSVLNQSWRYAFKSVLNFNSISSLSIPRGKLKKCLPCGRKFRKKENWFNKCIRDVEYDIVKLLNASCQAFNLSHGMQKGKDKERDRQRERNAERRRDRQREIDCFEPHSMAFSWSLSSGLSLSLSVSSVSFLSLSLCNLLSSCTLIDNIFVQCLLSILLCELLFLLLSSWFVCLSLHSHLVWQNMRYEATRQQTAHTHISTHAHTCTHNSYYEIFVKFHTKYKEACHVIVCSCVCVCEGIKWSLYKKLAAWFWLALLWLPAWLWLWHWHWQGLSPLASVLELIMKHCLLHKVWLRNENSKKTTNRAQRKLRREQAEGATLRMCVSP